MTAELWGLLPPLPLHRRLAQQEEGSAGRAGHVPPLPIPNVPVVQRIAGCAALQPWPSGISTRAALCLLNPLTSASPTCFHSLSPISSQVLGSQRLSDGAGLAVPGLCLLAPGLRFAGAALEHGRRSGDDHRAAVNAFGVSAGRRREVWITEPAPLNKLCTSISAHSPLPATNSVC